jgi:hypothetical protein
MYNFQQAVEAVAHDINVKRSGWKEGDYLNKSYDGEMIELSDGAYYTPSFEDVDANDWLEA